MSVIILQYVQWLQEKVTEMEKSPNAPSDDRLKHYKRQVDFLKGVLAADKCQTPLESPESIQLIPHGQATTNNQVITQQIHQRAQTQTTSKLRKELFGLDSSSESEVRNRKSIDLLSDTFQDQMMVEEKRREKMVEDMIAMTREWKEQSRVAGRVVKKDLETIDNSSLLADTNETQLKVESNRLTEFTSRTCNCWIWLMILFICCTFISMVMFIKMFKKKVEPSSSQSSWW
ncbi:UNVERIFIED_CONTAM: hypothetical protein RMT77_013292 [Armadillidium vulgare]